MKRLRSIREAFGCKVDDLADELGIAASTVRAWEKGSAAPSLANLRDLAMRHGTGIQDLVGAESLVQRPVRTCHLVSGEGIDGFWGDFGVMLPHSSEYRWFPITGASAETIEVEIRAFRMMDAQRRSLMVESLNSRMLWVNLTTVKCVSLCDEANEWPEPSVIQKPSPGRRQVDVVAHPSHQLPLVMYEVLTEYLRNGEWTDDISERLQRFADGFLDDRRENLSDDTLRRLLLAVRCWMTDGSVLWIDASPESIAGVIADLEIDGAGGLVRLVHDEEGFVEQAVPLEQVAMLEFPTVALHIEEQPVT